MAGRRRRKKETSNGVAYDFHPAKRKCGTHESNMGPLGSAETTTRSTNHYTSTTRLKLNPKVHISIQCAWIKIDPALERPPRATVSPQISVTRVDESHISRWISRCLPRSIGTAHLRVIGTHQIRTLCHPSAYQAGTCKASSSSCIVIASWRLMQGIPHGTHSTSPTT